MNLTNLGISEDIEDQNLKYPAKLYPEVLIENDLKAVINFTFKSN